MVASISARGRAQAALAYYAHLRHDDYYTRQGEPPGRWAGEGADRLSLDGPVTQSEFEAALKGIDSKTGEQLARHGGRSRAHSAGWDMTFSAPKSVSVLWALSDRQNRVAIEAAHRSAVLSASRHLERTAAWARRGKGGAIRLLRGSRALTAPGKRLGTHHWTDSGKHSQHPNTVLVRTSL